MISGLCAVLRYVIKTAQQYVVGTEQANCLKNLLGLRQNCLRACAEVSEWTLYAEVTLPQLVEKVLRDLDDAGPVPAELVQLENQLDRVPVKPSCRKNRKRRSADVVVSCTNVTDMESVSTEGRGKADKHLSAAKDESQNITDSFSSLQVVDSGVCKRLFVEGNNVQLTDLMLFLCIQLLFGVNYTECWLCHLPRVMSWYRRMATLPNIRYALVSSGLLSRDSVAPSFSKDGEILQSSVLHTASDSGVALKLVEDETSFSGISDCYDPTPVSLAANSCTTADDVSCIQHTDKTKFRTSQSLIDEVIAKATRTGLSLSMSPLGGGKCLRLLWEQYPQWVQPCGLGGVPDKRSARKLQQLENIAAAVQEIMSAPTAISETGVIADFCSGGGHVGILLAYLFPQYKVGNSAFVIVQLQNMIQATLIISFAL